MLLKWAKIKMILGVIIKFNLYSHVYRWTQKLMLGERNDFLEKEWNGDKKQKELRVKVLSSK